MHKIRVAGGGGGGVVRGDAGEESKSDINTTDVPAHSKTPNALSIPCPARRSPSHNGTWCCRVKLPGFAFVVLVLDATAQRVWGRRAQFLFTGEIAGGCRAGR